MPALLHEYESPIGDGNGAYYIAQVHGSRNVDGRWRGWIEFVPKGQTRPVLRTGTETTQATRDALAFWSTGLEPIYLQGALTRAEHLIEQRTPSRR
jgi:hypothetical protein